MFKQLTIEDAPAYYEHLNRIYEAKGLMSYKAPGWVAANWEKHVKPDVVMDLLVNPLTRVWAICDGDRITHSMRTDIWKTMPVFTIVNFKSESDSPFNVKRHLFPLWEQVMTSYEQDRFFTSYLVRPLVWTKNRRTPPFESLSPINRYHTVMEEVIPANTRSSVPAYDKIAGDVYPIDVAVISMHLRQEHRAFNGNERYFL